MSTTTVTVKKKPDAALIAVIVMVIVAAVMFLIAIIILFVLGGRTEFDAYRTNLLAAGGMLSLAVPLAVVSAVLTGLLISKRSKGKDARPLFWTCIILSILTGILVLVSAIISFVTANQIRALHPSDAQSLDAAGALMLIGFVVFIVAFFVFIFRARSRLAPEERKVATKNLFRRRRAATSANPDAVLLPKQD